MTSPPGGGALLRQFARGCGVGLGAGVLSATVLALLVLLIAPAAKAAADLTQLPEQRLNDVRSGSLLLGDGAHSSYRLAPRLKTDVDLRVSGMLVRAKLVQRFRNPSKQWVEGVYAFPLPENAAVDHLSMHIGERTIEGQVQERSQARRNYIAARSAGKKTALLEQQRPNIFTASVANIGPGEEVSVEIEYQQTLRYDQGEFHLRFPMVVSPRYIPGVVPPTAAHVVHFGNTGWARDTDIVPDASRITPPVVPPGHGRLNLLSLRVELDAGFALAKLRSSYHQVHIQRGEAGKAAVTLADGDVVANRDFELVWSPDPDHAPRAALFTERKGNDRYALVMVMPPTAAQSSAQRLPRDVSFVIDTSGSMGGPSIRQARDALNLALDRLHRQDRFNVIQFNSVTEALFQHAQPADAEHIDSAHRYVDRLYATGGTEMAGALKAALDGSEQSGRLRQVIFLTDGSVGNEAQLFDLIRRRLGGSRLFTVGIGSAPNSYFMHKAAQYGRGTFTYIGDRREVRDKMQGLFSKLESPVMSSLEVHGADGSSVAVWPRRLPDLYLREPVVFTAKLPYDMTGLTLSGRQGEQAWRIQLPLDDGRIGAGIGVLWARDKIAALMDSLHDGADAGAVRKAVTAVALAHHLVSRYTSLVAIDVTLSRGLGQTLNQRAVPVNLAHGWRYGKVFGGLPQTATPAQLKFVIGTLLLVIAAWLYRRRRRRV